MWIFTETGFLSVVRHRGDPELLLVRSRDRTHDIRMMACSAAFAHLRREGPIPGNSLTWLDAVRAASDLLKQLRIPSLLANPARHA